MVKIPPAWKKILEPQYSGNNNASLELVQSYRVVDADEDRIKQVRQIELNLLKKLQQVCQTHDIKVFAIYGTLLGAVRHGGIIPGDDDIDVALLRTDFDKLISLTAEFTGKYYLQVPTAENFFCGGYAKLRNVETTAISPDNWYVDCCEGISIDIFPIDSCSKSKAKEKWRQKIIRFYQRMLYAYTYGYFLKFRDMPMLKWKSYKYLGKLISWQLIVKRFNKALRSGDIDSNNYCCYTHYTPKIIKKGIPKKHFTSFVKVPFEDQEILVPKEFDEILTNRYGRYLNYSVYPSRRKYRHAFYVPNVSYKYYKPKFRDCCRPLPKDKKLVLIGDKIMVSEFFDRWNSKYIPELFVEVEEIMWKVPDIMKMVPVISFEDFSREDISGYYVVICSIHFRETEDLLKKIGYTDYYFFVWNRDWIRLSNPDVIIIEEELKNGKNKK